MNDALLQPSPDAARQTTVTPALWIPTIWLLILGSRPIARWFQPDASVTLGSEGSSTDRLLLLILMTAALVTLHKRRIDWSRFLKGNVWLVLLFVYLGLTISWSHIPMDSFKRWVRACADIFMALVVLSEPAPHHALETVFRRCAYLLIPTSLFLVKYVPHLGRAYGRWSGDEMWLGVTVHKSSLGLVCAFTAFFLAWALLGRWRAGQISKTPVRSSLDVLVLLVALLLLRGPGVSFSATATGILAIALTMLSIFYHWPTVARFFVNRLKIMASVFTALYLIFYETVIEISTSIAGRDETLTGRTDFWRPLLEFASHSPAFGVGYGGFWAPENPELEELFGPHFILANAHNGYIAVYVEVGIVGLLLLALFLLAHCAKIRSELGRRFDWSVFGACLLPMSLLYNNSESDFLQGGSLLWSILIFLSILYSDSCFRLAETGAHPLDVDQPAWPLLPPSGRPSPTEPVA